MFDFFIWKDCKQEMPYQGQIAEVICMVPAIYRGLDANGVPEWDLVRECERVVYWKNPDSNAVMWVKYFLNERNDSK